MIYRAVIKSSHGPSVFRDFGRYKQREILFRNCFSASKSKIEDRNQEFLKRHRVSKCSLHQQIFVKTFHFRVKSIQTLTNDDQRLFSLGGCHQLSKLSINLNPDRLGLPVPTATKTNNWAGLGLRKMIGMVRKVTRVKELLFICPKVVIQIQMGPSYLIYQK